METNETPKRKPTRLKGFDYSSPKGYFITICVENRSKILSTIVGEGLAPPEIQLTRYGDIVREQLLLLESMFPSLKVDIFAIMPNHIHAIFILLDEAGGASPSPTISDIVCAFKSQCTRACKNIGFEGKPFQRSFHDHVIRNKQDYGEVSKYIFENPCLMRIESNCLWAINHRAFIRPLI